MLFPMNASIRFLAYGLCAGSVLCSCSKTEAPGEAEDPDSPSSQVQRKTIEFWSADDFQCGVSYPWLNYAADFGAAGAWGHLGISKPEEKAIVAEDFAKLKGTNIQVVQWLLFGDGRAAPEFDQNGAVTGFDEHFFADVDTAIQLAKENDLYLIFALFDHLIADKAQEVNGVQMGGRHSVIANPYLRQSFIENALTPLFERYGDEERIVAWEIIRLPELQIETPGTNEDRPLKLDEMKSFIRDVAAFAHQHADQPVTVSSTSMTSAKEWKNCDLDYFQFNSFELAQKEAGSNLEFSKPLVLSGVLTAGIDPLPVDVLKQIRGQGYAGGLLWGLRPIDKNSDFSKAAQPVATWLRTSETAGK